MAFAVGEGGFFYYAPRGSPFEMWYNYWKDQNMGWKRKERMPILGWLGVSIVRGLWLITSKYSLLDVDFRVYSESETTLFTWLREISYLPGMGPAFKNIKRLFFLLCLCSSLFWQRIILRWMNIKGDYLKIISDIICTNSTSHKPGDTTDDVVFRLVNNKRRGENCGMDELFPPLTQTKQLHRKALCKGDHWCK